MKTAIYIGEPLREALDAIVVGKEYPGLRSGRINNIAERYNHLVAAAMPEFRRDEWYAIFGANKGLMVVGHWHNVQHVWANVADDPELDAKWDIDHTGLAARLRDLPLPARVAVAEAIERFWAARMRAVSTHSELSNREALAQTGARLTPE